MSKAMPTERHLEPNTFPVTDANIQYNPMEGKYVNRSLINTPTDTMLDKAKMILIPKNKLPATKTGCFA